MRKPHTFDFWILFVWNFVAFFLSYFLSNNYLTSACFFFLIPSIYILCRNKNLFILKKPFWFALAFTIPSFFVFDYLAHQDGSFQNFPVFFDHFLGVPVEDIFWTLLYFIYASLFYKYFFDNDKRENKKLPHSFKWLLGGGILASAVFVSVIYLGEEAITIKYFYAWVVLVIFWILPALIMMRYKLIFEDIARAGIFFMVLSILYEYIAYHNYEWTFPGTNFVGWVTLFDARFPLEELMWLIFAIPAYLAYYEFFADDRR